MAQRVKRARCVSMKTGVQIPSVTPVRLWREPGMLASAVPSSKVEGEDWKTNTPGCSPAFHTACVRSPPCLSVAVSFTLACTHTHEHTTKHKH